MSVEVGQSSVGMMVRRASALGLAVRAAGGWPESIEDSTPEALAGFIVSSFSPLVAAAADRCLRQVHGEPPTRAGAPGPARAEASARVTAIVIVSALGDVTSAVHVAQAVDAGRRIGPLLFYQSVPNSVAGYLAARWGLTGPVVCLGSPDDGLDVAALLIEDGDADEALVIAAEQAPAAGERDTAVAVLVCRASGVSGEQA